MRLFLSWCRSALHSVALHAAWPGGPGWGRVLPRCPGTRRGWGVLIVPSTNHCAPESSLNLSPCLFLVVLKRWVNRIWFDSVLSAPPTPRASPPPSAASSLHCHNYRDVMRMIPGARGTLEPMTRTVHGPESHGNRSFNLESERLICWKLVAALFIGAGDGRSTISKSQS